MQQRTQMATLSKSKCELKVKCLSSNSICVENVSYPNQCFGPKSPKRLLKLTRVIGNH